MVAATHTASRLLHCAALVVVVVVAGAAPASALLLYSNLSFAGGCTHHFYRGVPPSRRANCTNSTGGANCVEMCHNGFYASLQNIDLRSPEFSAAYLTSEQAWIASLNDFSRPSWSLSASIPASWQYALANPLWDGTGAFDKGHMINKEQMDFARGAVDSTFDITNVVQQLDSCNRGPWATLESDVRDWVRARNQSLYIVVAIGYKNYAQPNWTANTIVADYMVMALCDANASSSVALVAQSSQPSCGGALKQYWSVREAEAKFLNGTRLFQSGCRPCELNNSHWLSLASYSAGNSTPQLCKRSRTRTATRVIDTTAEPTTTTGTTTTAATTTAATTTAATTTATTTSATIAGSMTTATTAATTTDATTTTTVGSSTTSTSEATSTSISSTSTPEAMTTPTTTTTTTTATITTPTTAASSTTDATTSAASSTSQTTDSTRPTTGTVVSITTTATPTTAATTTSPTAPSTSAVATATTTATTTTSTTTTTTGAPSTTTVAPAPRETVCGQLSLDLAAPIAVTGANELAFQSDLSASTKADVARQLGGSSAGFTSTVVLSAAMVRANVCVACTTAPPSIAFAALTCGAVLRFFATLDTTRDVSLLVDTAAVVARLPGAGSRIIAITGASASIVGATTVSPPGPSSLSASSCVGQLCGAALVGVGVGVAVVVVVALIVIVARRRSRFGTGRDVRSVANTSSSSLSVYGEQQHRFVHSYDESRDIFGVDGNDGRTQQHGGAGAGVDDDIDAYLMTTNDMWHNL